MKLPTKVLSHCLAHGVAITPDSLRKNIIADQRLGFAGMVIVPVLIGEEHSPEAIAQVFKETESTGLICGLIPGNGPSPFEQPELALASILKQARYAIALAKRGLGPPVLVGPLHTHHRQPLPGWSEKKLNAWIERVDEALGKLGLRALFEPLNPTEDQTPDPFWHVYNGVLSTTCGVQFDTGHAHARGIMCLEVVRLMTSKIGYFELANVGRWPLDKPMGIDFADYAATMALLPNDCVVGVEPFCQKVIGAFDLKTLCTTDVPGEECLVRDAIYLKELGIMAK